MVRNMEEVRELLKQAHKLALDKGVDIKSVGFDHMYSASQERLIIHLDVEFKIIEDSQ